MRERPADVDESELRDALRAWGIDAVALTHAPIGFGDHHWTAVDDQGRRWFVTVADLADKPHCGIGKEAAARGLSQAMDDSIHPLHGSAARASTVAPAGSGQ